MFDILLGWRKASQWKKLIKHAQCRLKFPKIKRESIIRQLRDNIAQLLVNGDYENAYSRVEQPFKDQDLWAIYSETLICTHRCLLYHVNCRDCPNDINEAVSTLIYAATWCGDLPELQKIQKLFGERYGCKFAKAAVELYPGTLVDCQIREKLCIKSIPDNVKLRLLGEVAKDYSLQQELFGCDNKVKLHAPKLCGASDCQYAALVVKGEAQVNKNNFHGKQTPASYTKDELSERSFNSSPGKQTVEPLQVTAMHRSAEQVEGSNEPKTVPSQLSGRSSLESCNSIKLSSVSLENMVEMRSAKPASEIKFQLHKNVFNFEEVKEFQFSPLKDLCGEDKRIFLFNSSIFPLGDGYRFRGGSLLFLSGHGCGKNENDIGKERGQSSGDFYQKFSCQLGHQCKNFGNMPPQVGRSSLFLCNEKLGPPQQLHYMRMKQKHMCCNKMHQHIQPGKCKFGQRKSYCRYGFSSDMDVNCSLVHPCYYNVMEFHNDCLIKKCKKLGEADGSEFSFSHLMGSSPHEESGRADHASYVRTSTLSPQKMKGTEIENNLQSASLEFQHLNRSISSSQSHVYPKLPDNDDLAAKFVALKKEYQQRASPRRE